MVLIGEGDITRDKLLRYGKAMNLMRKLLTLALVAILLVITSPTVIDSYARIEPQMPDRYTLHIVQAGDTLWDISERYMPGVDNRIGVRWIRESNGLEPSEMIYPGDQLNVPDPSGEMDEPWGQD
jgi:competence protein ComGC